MEDEEFPDMVALQKAPGREKKNARKARKNISLKTLSAEDQCGISEKTQSQESSPFLLLPVNSYLSGISSILFPGL